MGQEFREYVRNVAIDREKVLVAAQKLVQKRRYDRAIVEYQKLILEDPNDARTLLKIGDLQSKLELYADAVATYERVGRHYAQQGFALKAIAVFKQIRDIIARHVPDLDETYAHIPPQLAELYQQLGLTSDALAALDEVATRHLRQGRDAEAIEVFQRIVELDPTNPLPHLRLAEALSRARDFDGAVTSFGIAAGQLVKLGRRDDALKVLERLLHHRPDPTHARIAAELYLARGSANDGLQSLAKLQLCFQANPKDLDTLNLLARAFNAIGQAAKAIEVQKEMARIAREQGRRDLWRSLVAKLQRLAPDDEDVVQLVSMESVAPVGATRETQSSIPPRPSYPSTNDPYEQVRDSEIEAEELLESTPPASRSQQTRETASQLDVVEVESSYIEADTDLADEDLYPASGAPPSIPHVLAEATSLRQARAFDGAIEVLRRALWHAPRAFELRTALRDVLLEAGRQAEGVAEMITIASLHVDALDGEAAAQVLHDVVALDPGNVRATEMLRELGYELLEELQVAPARPEGDVPLPSYDLEEIGPEDVAPAVYADATTLAIPPPPPLPMRLDEIDEPFESSPLPSFPLEGAAAAGVSLGYLPTSALQPPDSVTDRMDATEIAAPMQGAAELEDALEEAEFFVSRGLFDDARTILEEQLGRVPNHPLLIERLTEIENQLRGIQIGSGTRAVPRDGDLPSPRDRQSTLPPVDRSFDIAASLEALEEQPRAGGGLAFDGDDINVEEVFAKFKEGVAKQVAVDDGQSHYDLGVAYKEMGLVDDALREFETAARDPKRACVCLSMIGMLQAERGGWNEAIEAFSRGLAAPGRTAEQETVLEFEIATAYEAKKMPKEALAYYQRVQKRDPNYRDVQDRVRRLSKGEPKPLARAAAVGADDDFDRAFDDVFGRGKLP